MPRDWKKIITKNSEAELRTLIADGQFQVTGSLIILKGLPTQDPGQAGQLWEYIDAQNLHYLKVSAG
jgi:hypothetical protein